MIPTDCSVLRTPTIPQGLSPTYEQTHVVSGLLTLVSLYNHNTDRMEYLIMAFDGITISNIVNDLNNTILGGRLYKIAQPESDELLLTVKTSSGQYRVVLSANASLPLAYITDDNKPSPATAPNFVMLLRKHINNGRIISVTQPSLERIIDIEIEHLDELGDLCKRHLITEFMGKHSNIILCDDDNNILDSIKHVSAQISSVREVLPGRKYFIPNTANKHNPLDMFSAKRLAVPLS